MRSWIRHACFAGLGACVVGSATSKAPEREHSGDGDGTLQGDGYSDAADGEGGDALPGDSCCGEPAVYYATEFTDDEAPLSDQGAWHHDGLDWTWVHTSGGLAYGTQSGHDGFDDSYAYLSGFPADQAATAIIHLDEGQVAAPYVEVELLLRWTDSAHYSTGYECNLAFNGSYAQIIRWPGPLGTSLADYAYLDSGYAPQGVHSGDVFHAEIIGDTITVTLNGEVVASAVDDTIATGNPGIGFYWQDGAGGPEYSFDSYAAESR